MGLWLAAAVLGLGAAFAIFTLVRNRSAQRYGSNANVRSLMVSQRISGMSSQVAKGDLAKQVASATAAKAKMAEEDSATRLLTKRLKYADVSLSPSQFRAIVVACIAVIYVVTAFIPRIDAIVHVIVAVGAGIQIPNFYVNSRLKRRFNAFDRDFSPFMLSLVGLLKTGMNILTAVETAAERLGPDSMFRLEVVRMMERLRFGVSEDQAIGVFAEGIDHPDVELFVQAMLLSKRVGGSLTDTLERLSRQARRRAQFRMQAHGAVGQQRGSVWIIIIFIAGIEFLIWRKEPSLVEYGLRSDTGFVMWQVAILLCWFAVWLVAKITKIRV